MPVTIISTKSAQFELDYCLNDHDTLVIVCHPHSLYGGTMDNKVVTTVFRHYRDLGCNVVRFNFRGVGESLGEFDHGIGEQQDVLMVMEWFMRQYRHVWAEQHHYTNQRIQRLVMVGFSFGAYVSALTAVNTQWEQYPIQLDQLVLIAPAVTRFSMEHLSLSLLKQSNITVILAEQDEIVPLAAAQQWTQHHGLQAYIIEAASHFFHGKLEALKTQLPMLCAQ